MDKFIESTLKQSGKPDSSKRKRETSLVWRHFKRSKKDNQVAIEVCCLLKHRLPDRFNQYETRTIPRIATLLDPRFKKDGFHLPSNPDQAAKALEQEICNILSKTPQELPPPPRELKKTMFTFLQYKTLNKVHSNRADTIIALRQYFEHQNESEDLYPLQYWKMYTEFILALKDLSKKIFCVPASSSESERTFSKAGQILSDRRCSLKSNIVDKLLFINKNMDLFLNNS